jgi:hypothetical protein
MAEERRQEQSSAPTHEVTSRRRSVDDPTRSHATDEPARASSTSEEQESGWHASRDSSTPVMREGVVVLTDDPRDDDEAVPERVDQPHDPHAHQAESSSTAQSSGTKKSR